MTGHRAVVHDEATAAYFDAYTPEYSVERLGFGVGFLRDHATAGESLLDIGCGVGNTLEHVLGETPVTRVAGMDVSPRCLALTRERLGCPTWDGSIFDPALPDRITDRYDYAVMAAVLHHLIGRTRRESRRYVQLALANAAALLRPGGHLVLLEPTFTPRWAMTALFWLKKAVSRLTPRRVGIGGYWNNIGAPVVSYCSTAELRALVAEVPGLDVVAEDVVHHRLGRLLGAVLGRETVTLVVRKA